MKPTDSYIKLLPLLAIAIVCNLVSYAQFHVQKTNSWEEVKRNKRGSVTALWYDIEPFIYRDGKGGIIGVEHLK